MHRGRREEGDCSSEERRGEEKGRREEGRRGEGRRGREREGEKPSDINKHTRTHVCTHIHTQTMLTVK